MQVRMYRPAEPGFLCPPSLGLAVHTPVTQPPAPAIETGEGEPCLRVQAPA